MNYIQNIDGKFVFLSRSTFAEDTLTVCALWCIDFFQWISTC